MSHHLARINEYTTIMAREYKAKGRRSGLADLIFRPPWTFFKKYLLQRGILDGSAGFVICVLASYYVFLKYAKLREFGRADG
ncbi:MAG: hypothetical protein M5R36_22135 [Deltaproteobacteria bacterium]|nr:hypothetical protein [Deltaproteobacteria bacterium]